MKKNKNRRLIMEKVLSNVLGMLGDLIAKLREGVITPEQLGLFLKKENPFVDNNNLKVWKTIQVGTGLDSVGDFMNAILKAGVKISELAEDIMGESYFYSSIFESPMELDLCVKTTEEIIGIGKKGTMKEIYDGIKKIGGELLPFEAGLQLRLQYLVQPQGESLIIAMDLIEDSNGDSRVFLIGHDDDALWLNSSDVLSDALDDVFMSNCCWVFRIYK